MTALAPIQERLATLQAATAELEEKIDRLASSQPDSLEQDGNDQDATTEEAAEVRQDLKDTQEDVELLEVDISFLPPCRAGSEEAHIRENLGQDVKRLRDQLKQCEKKYRKAVLQAKHNIDIARRQEHRRFIEYYAQVRSQPTTPTTSMTNSGTLPPPPPKRTLGRRSQQASALSDQDRRMVDASSSVTDRFRKMVEEGFENLGKSEETRKLFNESRTRLEQANDSYSTLPDRLRQSRGLVQALMRNEKSDEWYLRMAMYVELATLAWLVFRRWLWSPFWWLVWWPIRILFGTTMRVGGALVPGGSGQGVAVVPPISGETPVSVRGLPDETVPSIQVGEPGTTEEDSSRERAVDGSEEDESMVAKVGRIVDERTDWAAEERKAEAGEEQGAQGVSEQVGEKDEL